MKQPTLDNEEALIKVKHKINQIKQKLKNTEDFNTETRVLEQLSTEYEKQIELRMDQVVSLENQWKIYQTEQKKNRKKEIEKRQIEFNLELDKEYQNDLKSLQPSSLEVDIQQLVDFLESQKNNSSIIKVPTDLLEAFWTLDIHVPVFPSEIPTTLAALNNRR